MSEDLYVYDDELPLPEEDEDLVDLRFIHWGYLNCCQTLHKGRKAKREVWNTYWVTLCGSTLRFYLDGALHSYTVFQPPPPSSFGPLPENKHKAAFFDLDGAEMEMIDDGKIFRKRLRRSVYAKIYRRHLFKVKLPKINSTYVFQAPSQSALYTWISKLQESIDAIENHEEILTVAEERLQLAQFMMEKKLRNEMDEKAQHELEKQVEDSFDVIEDEEVVEKVVEETKDLNPRLRELKLLLLEKREFLWQLETQIIDFLGNKGDFSRREFTTKTKQDYYLVVGRMETFIPAGTNVTIFGQLPNGRWRCLVEMDDLIKTMNDLVQDLLKESREEGHANEQSNALKSVLHNLSNIEDLNNNLPNYPLIGSFPTSILDYDFDIIRASGTPTSDLEEPFEKNTQEPILAPYSYHKREHRKTPLKPLDELQVIDLENEDVFALDENLTRSRDSSSFTEESNFEDVAMNGDEDEGGDSDAESIYDNVSQEERTSFLRGLEGSGIVISKKLRQKGISIIVGSSSSEDEDDEEAILNNIRINNNNNNGTVYRKFNPRYSSGQENELSSERNSYIRTKKRKDLKQSYSLDRVDNGFSTKTDILRRFGQKSISISQDKDLAKAVLELFETEKGPDVKPPRNERRTLKLHKSEDEGFGFWLQTYDFPKLQKRTFVRYVEDEGPAYMAGLREGDIIVEVNDENVEEMQHAQTVKLITKAKTQLKLVVKFIDAVRRVELTVRQKKKETKLKTKQKELEQLELDEQNILNGLPSSYDTMDPSRDGDDVSLHTSTESEISSIASSNSDELIVRTSKFAKRSSRVLDSIKELNCNDSVSSFSSTDLNRVSTTTEDELLDLYCERLDYHNSLPRIRTGNGLKRVESMPVQKYRSLPRKRVIDLDNGNYAREYTIDNNLSSERQYGVFDLEESDSSDDGSSSQSSVGPNVQDLDRVPRRNRPKSYKLAMNSFKHLEGDVDEV